MVSDKGGEIMPRVMVFLMMLMFVLPSDGSSQAVPSSGDRIRIKQVDGTILTGTLANVSTETVQLAVDPLGGTIEVPVERIDLLETSLGQQRNFGKNFVVTVAVAAAVGGTIYALTWSPCVPRPLAMSRLTEAQPSAFQ